MRAFALALVAAVVVTGCVAPPKGAAVVVQGLPAAAQVVLVDERVTVSAAVSAGADRCAPQCGGAVLASPLVPPGTTRVEVLAEWEGGPQELRLVYDTGGSAEALRTTLLRGEPLVIEVAPEMTDAAGQRTSHWWWGVFAMADPAGTVPATEVALRVVAHVADVESHPPAPTGVLVDDVPRTNRGAPAAFCPGCQGTWWSSGPGGIVGPDATRVRATLFGELAGASPPQLNAWIPGLDEFATFDLVGESGDARTYELAVEPGWRDDASQWKSLWWFFLTTERPNVVLEGTVSLHAEAIVAPSSA